MKRIVVLLDLLETCALLDEPELDKDLLALPPPFEACCSIAIAVSLETAFSVVNRTVTSRATTNAVGKHGNTQSAIFCSLSSSNPDLYTRRNFPRGHVVHIPRQHKQSRVEPIALNLHFRNRHSNLNRAFIGRGIAVESAFAAAFA